MVRAVLEWILTETMTTIGTKWVITLYIQWIAVHLQQRIAKQQNHNQIVRYEYVPFYNDLSWPQGGSSNNPCSETYHGPSAASEPETKITVEYFEWAHN